MGFVLFLLIPSLLLLVPVLHLSERISRQANRGGIAGTPYLWTAIVGSFVGWMSANVIAVVVSNMPVSRRFPDYAIYACFIALCLVGATLAPALCYLLVRMRTARDPDYDDCRMRSSYIAHIPQPRDGDDVLSE
jgi:hypothetical protein